MAASDMLPLAPSCKVWVGGLPKEATVEEVEMYFSDAKMTRLLKAGTAIVAYETAEQAQEAIETFNGTDFLGHTIKCDVWTLAGKGADKGKGTSPGYAQKGKGATPGGYAQVGGYGAYSQKGKSQQKGGRSQDWMDSMGYNLTQELDGFYSSVLEGFSSEHQLREHFERVLSIRATLLAGKARPVAQASGKGVGGKGIVVSPPGLGGKGVVGVVSKPKRPPNTISAVWVQCENINWKSVFGEFLVCDKGMTVRKGDLEYENAGPVGAHYATITCKCLGDSSGFIPEYTSMEAAPTVKDAEMFAAKAALYAMNPALHNLAERQHNEWRSSESLSYGADSDVALKKRKIGAVSALDAKGRLNNACQILLGRPLQKGDVTFDTQSIDSLFVCSISVPGVGAEIVSGEFCEEKRAAELSAAETYLSMHEDEIALKRMERDAAVAVKTAGKHK